MSKKVKKWLIVDGYNIIGYLQTNQWDTFDMEEERLRLIRALSEYQSMTGIKILLVFDAHLTLGAEMKSQIENISVYYTKKGQTADELIERLVKTYKKTDQTIYVATSDYLEQRMIFGQGAYRISARELLEEIQTTKEKQKQIMTKKIDKITVVDQLPTEIRDKMEFLRRKK